MQNGSWQATLLMYNRNRRMQAWKEPKEIFGRDSMWVRQVFRPHWINLRKTAGQRSPRSHAVSSNVHPRALSNMETTGYYSQHLTDWINQLHPEVGVTIENARNIHAFIQSLNLPHKTDKLDAQARSAAVRRLPLSLRKASLK